MGKTTLIKRTFFAFLNEYKGLVGKAL